MFGRFDARNKTVTKCTKCWAKLSFGALVNPCKSNMRTMVLVYKNLQKLGDFGQGQVLVFISQHHGSDMGMSLVKNWVASGLRLPRSEVGRWPLSNWAMQFSHVPLLILEYVTPLLSVCPCHYRVTCVLTLIGLRVVAIGSSEVLLSGLVDTSHLSAKYQSVPWHRTEVRSRPHDITDSYLLKLTLEPRSRLTSVVCAHAFGLAKHLEIMTDGGGVMPTPECRNPNPYGMVCVSLDCFAEDIMGSCHSLSAMPWFAGDFSLCPGLEP